MLTQSLDRPHPVTGLSNARLATWLFLASEVMLFGALFSAYLMLRWGAPGDWPHHALDRPTGTLNTLVLLASGMTLLTAVARLRTGEIAGFRRYLTATSALAMIFVAVKLFEWAQKLGHDLTPATHNFYALYFLLTGIHAAHVIGGIAVNCYLFRAAPRLFPGRAALLAERAGCTSLYWQFVDAVWVALYLLLYWT